MKHLIQFKRVKAILGVILLAGLSSVTRVAAQTGDGDKYHDKGVTIDGVTWATRNVDMPGTFAATPQSPGMLYQWGSRIGWSSNDPLINSNGETVWYWDYQTHGTEWEPANDPCPSGWRLPSPWELGLLITSYKLGPVGELYFGDDEGNGVYLPMPGFREVAGDNSQRYVGQTRPQRLRPVGAGLYYHTGRADDWPPGYITWYFTYMKKMYAPREDIDLMWYPAQTFPHTACSIRCVRK